MPGSDSGGLILQVRQYQGASGSNDLRGEFVELVRELRVAANKAAIVAHECAHASVAPAWPATVNTLIKEHNLRVAIGDLRLPVLGPKAHAFRELLLETV